MKPIVFFWLRPFDLFYCVNLLNLSEIDANVRIVVGGIEILGELKEYILEIDSLKIVSVNISDEKGTIKRPVDHAVVCEKGIEGDAHSGHMHCQVSLFSQEEIDKFSREAGRKIFPGEFAENITTSGADLSKIRMLDRFKIGAVELEVVQMGKVSYRDSSEIFKETDKCVMPEEGVFCRVLCGGVIKKGDNIGYCPKALRVAVVTVSDRANRGEYEDRSGPEIVKKMEEFSFNNKWRFTFQKMIIPDEPEVLEQKIKDLTEQVDIIFTTGGTGIGPRDITPDVLEPLLDKTIPGIMEFIRVKYGAEIPNALLSRSIAGVIGKTLVYSLPGSVKAVREYMDEILKTLEHSLLMLKGIDAH